MVSQAEIRRGEKGFLLIEALYSIVLLVISSLIIASYWNTIAGAYQQATKKLHALQVIKNVYNNYPFNIHVSEYNDFLLCYTSTPVMLTSCDGTRYIEAECFDTVITSKENYEKQDLSFYLIVPKS